MDAIEGYRPKEKIIEMLDLERCEHDTRILFQPCSLKKNWTIDDGMKWLTKYMVAV